MQTKIKQIEEQLIEVEHRLETRLHERAGALAVAFITVTGGLTAIGSEDARRVMSGLAIHPAYAIVEHSNKESETARHSIRIENVVRSMPVSGQ